MTDQTYRVIGGHVPFESDERLEHGDTFEPTDRELELFPTKFEIVQGDVATDENDTEDTYGSGGDADDNDGGAERAAEFVENSASGVAEAIADGQCDGHLEAVREAEGERSGHSDRTTVHDALDARAEQTGEDAGERPDEE